MKMLAAEHEFAGSVDELNGIKAKNRELASKKALGQVVGDLTGNFLQVAAWVRTSFRIVFSEDNFKRVERKLAGLVDLRNELAHHFLEMFDFRRRTAAKRRTPTWTSASSKLMNYEELRQSADQAATTKALHANVMNTPEFANILFHGILPNGAGVDWSYSTIVNLLRDAETVLAEDGWTSLVRAIDHIHRAKPEHSPKKYGCSSWCHLLHECKQFEVRKHQPAAGLPTEVWYRSHDPSGGYHQVAHIKVRPSAYQ